MAQIALEDQLHNYPQELLQMGCLEIPNLGPCTLRNPIHPMFSIDRWMTGYGQATHTFYDLMTPALKLASLMLTEPCILPWFTHLFYAKRCRTVSASGEEYIYLHPREFEITTADRQRVRDEIDDLTEVVIFMFTPSQYSNSHLGQAWGVTSPEAEYWPWSRHFYPEDYPHLSDEALIAASHGYHIPEITLSDKFARYFKSGYAHSTQSQDFRLQYMFATTLVHELAHAFWMWIGRSNYENQEPRWYKQEPYPELGYSWEAITLGRISDPMMDENGIPTVLLSTRTEGYPPNMPMDTLEYLHFTTHMNEVYLDPYTAAHLMAHGGRGSSWFAGRNPQRAVNDLTVIHAIPTVWVAGWFSEAWWEGKRKHWRERNAWDPYGPPPLGPTFILVLLKPAFGEPRMWVCAGEIEDPNLEWVHGALEGAGLFDQAAGRSGGGVRMGRGGRAWRHEMDDEYGFD
jgi:hypothetical protein